MEKILDQQEYNFEVPTKKINTGSKIEEWENSEAYQLYLGFIMSISESIVGKKITDEVEISPNCLKIVRLLEKLHNFTNELPPVEIQARYGNPAYRDWLEKLETGVEGFLEASLPERFYPAIQELAPYLLDSFGNWTRIDYGTGHEMAFVMFVCCLFKIGVLTEADKPAVGLRLFKTYFDLARHIQQIYRMEPAGSMGVWNLDDFQFVSFILGAAQLSKNVRVKPKSIPDPEISDLLKNDYHLFACVDYIHNVKTGPFHEHSNQLWNISGVQLWTKVYTGLIKMYRAEVLCKFPVIQHTLFGSIFSLEKATVKLEIPGESGAHQRPGLNNVPLAGPCPGILPMGMMPAGGMMPMGAMPGGIMPMGAMPGGNIPGRNMPGGIMPLSRMPGSGMPPGGLLPGSLPGVTPNKKINTQDVKMIIETSQETQPGIASDKTAVETPISNSTPADEKNGVTNTAALQSETSKN